LTLYRSLADKNPEAYTPELAMTLNNLGILYSSLSNYEEAEKALNEALTLYRSLADKNPEAYTPELAMTINNLGNLYRRLSNYEEAEKKYKEALKERMSLPDTGANIFKGLGELYEETGEDSKAADNYLQAAANYFLLTIKGVNNLHQVQFSLEKSIQLGENTTKGDAEIIQAAFNYLGNKDTKITSSPTSETGNAIKDAINGKKTEIDLKNELDKMGKFLAELIIHKKEQEP